MHLQVRSAPRPVVYVLLMRDLRSQCTYRCVVLPDSVSLVSFTLDGDVSMHLQVRGAP